ncbi:site-specific DNA-methyltransferase [Sphingomonas sp. AP4-R1]|uniref:DNA methyltransferase n=1 Tax=Sphingomonas sp. AP4-R1 TaxID=2735134 RepID=UPI0014933709|nr:DNA methyltransferase [Sphingomonas sp. AP4-R1]QJU57579.1 site-specific DNA-methyltransferase [Sphingomonas sp. AP4-R1]
MSKLFYGDNLEVLRAHIADASVDLVYLDPPFNSNASYNILFKAPNGAGADASIEAFDDTWAWGPAASAALMDITESGNHRLHVLMQAMRTAIGENAMMAYLAMMAVRLVELHRVLKPTGSLYLHCDPTASHYLKLVLDAVFGAENYRNEITWKRTTTHSDSKTWSKVSDVILFYTKSRQFIWNTPREAHGDDYVSTKYRLDDEDGRGRYRLDNMTSPSPRPNMMYEWIGFPFPPMGWRYKRETMQRLHDEGRIRYPLKSDGTPDLSRRPQLKRYLEEMEGGVVGSVWTDIPPINSQAQERLGYPTQKPIVLLERIIAASSNPGDVVLDPFCGCGTAVDAAQKLGRRWIGIDVTHLAIGLIEKRLRAGYGDHLRFETIGSPRDLASAQRLAEDDPHQFQAWITLRLGGYPWMGGRKGGDKGVDGYFYYVGMNGATETGVISVKAGHNVNPAMVRDLGRVMQRDGHRLGLFVCAALPTRGMIEEANSHGLIETEFGRYPALQIFTLAELFQDRHPRLPPLVSPHRRAPRVETRVSHQAGAQASLI